jgi:hypothetical protein
LAPNVKAKDREQKRFKKEERRKNVWTRGLSDYKQRKLTSKSNARRLQKNAA